MNSNNTSVRSAHRIISLVPSITDTLFHLGLGDSVVALTSYCNVPAEYSWKLPTIGGPGTLDLGKIRALRPELILAGKEENNREQVESLMQDFLIHVFEVKSVADALEMIITIGELTGRSDAASNLIIEIKARFDRLESEPAIKVAYPVWNDPLMVAGSDTYIDDVLRHGGFENIFCKPSYFQCEYSDLEGADVIVLPSEPCIFSPEEAIFFRQRFPKSVVFPVDGRIFCWYGSRMLRAPEYMERLRKIVQRVRA